MSLDCGATFVKYVLCLFNFALFVSNSNDLEVFNRLSIWLWNENQWAGAAVLGVGIWLAADQTSFLTLIKVTQAENVQVQQLIKLHLASL